MREDVCDGISTDMHGSNDHEYDCYVDRCQQGNDAPLSKDAFERALRKLDDLLLTSIERPLTIEEQSRLGQLTRDLKEDVAPAPIEPGDATLSDIPRPGLPFPNAELRREIWRLRRRGCR